MKIKPEHYKELDTAIHLRFSDSELLTYWNAYKSKGLSAMRYRWDMFHAIDSNGSISKEFYTYMNDNHIDTALRKLTDNITNNA